MEATDKAIQTLFKLATEVKEAWTNASPGSSFPPQSISVDLTDADAVAVVSKIYDTSGRVKTYVFPTDQAEGFMDFAFSAGAGGARNINRTLSITQKSLKFYEGLTVYSGGQATDNTCAIPLKIFTLKLMGGGNPQD